MYSFSKQTLLLPNIYHQICAMGKRADIYMRQRLRMAYIISVASIAMVLFVLGLIGLVVLSSHQISDYVKENLKLQIGLITEISEEDAEDLRAQLQAQPYVKQVVLITPDQALEEFKQTWNEDPIEVLGFNPLGYTLELSLKADFTSVDSIRIIEARMMNDYADYIRGISKDETLIHEVNTNTRKIQIILAIVCLVLALMMVALINNTIRLAIYSKRFIIKTMQLVGATPGFIRRPFLINGLLQGLVAGFISVISLLFLVFVVAKKFLQGEAVFDSTILAVLLSAIVLAGITISYISTFFAVRKFLRIRIDELY